MHSIPIGVVSPHYAPSNLTCGQRTRLLVNHLAEFGCEPILFTVDPKHYEETLDPSLVQLCNPFVKTIRVPAIPSRPLAPILNMRLLGDLSLRAFFPLWKSLRDEIRKNDIKLLLFVIPPNYSAILGPLLRPTGVRYVIDFVDPWVYPVLEEEKRSVKSLLSHLLARLLEPIATRYADGFTSVATTYLEPLFRRKPELRKVPHLGIPYGNESGDFEPVTSGQYRSETFEKLNLPSGAISLTYAGALLPRSVPAIRAALDAGRQMRESGADIRFIFLGTRTKTLSVEKIAEDMGMSEQVYESPGRVPYLEVLACLKRSSINLVLGSDEKHYTPSKIYQVAQAGRPVFAVIHPESPARKFLENLPATEMVLWESGLEDGIAQRAAQALRALFPKVPNDYIMERHSLLEAFSAKNMAAELARFLLKLEKAS